MLSAFQRALKSFQTNEMRVEFYDEKTNYLLLANVQFVDENQGTVMYLNCSFTTSLESQVEVLLYKSLDFNCINTAQLTKYSKPHHNTSTVHFSRVNRTVQLSLSKNKYSTVQRVFQYIILL